MFANMYLAYETLSEGFKKLIQPLQAVHDLMGNRDFQNRDPAQVKFLREKNPLVAQPLVRFHPETGRPSLYLAEQQVTQIVGMTRQESASILRYLVEHSIQPAFTYRHRWQLHDILVWDNRCTMHFAVPDFDQSQSRVMHRINTNGEYSGEVVTEDELEAKTHARESSIMSAVSA